MDKINSIGTLNKTKGFKILHVNVRSLLKKIDQFRMMLADVDLDVKSISETWLNESVSSKSVELDRYRLYRQDRDFSGVAKKRGGGLLTYIHADHAANSEPLLELSTASKDIEAQWSIIHRPHCKDTVICNVY